MPQAIIVDDEALSIRRLKRLLEEEGTVGVSETFLGPKDVCDYVREHPVEIAFLDIAMPAESGMSLSARLHAIRPSLDIVFITGYDEYAVEAFELNALDYLMKPVTEQRLSKTLAKIKRKHGTAPVQAATDSGSRLAAEMSGNGPLTEQELRVVRLIADGLSNKEIAGRLHIAPETVKWHIKNAYRKLGIGNRVLLLRHAKDNGWLN
ncbi:response regulator transcription factor [Paenibacillus spiritus]|uniref:Response regulator transcription factor n=1 Tax=Paenibacillus spiritus TaxID=2496557 RepID=A0A5J5GC57_9BACL|nr:response regulator transcription factor [Paenibacillus spiritus]KAA9005024.1 response regulator transcription factor [Paenibacillus spiritus]